MHSLTVVQLLHISKTFTSISIKYHTKKITSIHYHMKKLFIGEREKKMILIITRKYCRSSKPSKNLFPINHSIIQTDIIKVGKWWIDWVINWVILSVRVRLWLRHTRHKLNWSPIKIPFIAVWSMESIIYISE